MGEAVEIFIANNNGFSNFYEKTDQKINTNVEDSCWYEEVIDDDLKWSFALNRFVIPNTTYYLIFLTFIRHKH